MRPPYPVDTSNSRAAISLQSCSSGMAKTEIDVNAGPTIRSKLGVGQLNIITGYL